MSKGNKISFAAVFWTFYDVICIAYFRLRLHGRGFQSKRLTASKTTRFRRVYSEPTQPLNPTVYVKKLSHQTRALPGQFQNRRLAFLFVTLLERIDEKENILRHLCLLLRYASRFIESKIHESCKSEVKPQIKVVNVQQSAALRTRFTIFTSRASQFRDRPFLNRCGFAVYTIKETVSFWKRSTFESVFKTTRFW